MLREQRSPLDTLQNPVLDSWVGLAHLKLSSDIEYLIWKKVDSTLFSSACLWATAHPGTANISSSPKVWNPAAGAHKAHWAVKSLPAWTISPQCCHLLCSCGCSSVCLCSVLNSFIVGNPSCLLYHSVAHCCEIGSAESISSQLQDRWHLSVVREGLLRKGLANASQRTSDLTFPERDADSLDYK